MIRPFALARILIGLAALLAPRATARLFGFPSGDANATARAMGRLFGVRDVALGVLTLQAAGDPRASGRLHRILACVDGGDAGAGLVALVRREGVDRAALGIVVVATAAAATGLRIARAEDERAMREVVGT